ncbi:hypothetical protein [Streptomyces drozdowiczii]|uniref:hypothetical protein n=1 Tax=Streptomyces drozdowiczii TaxID=202862 RepID=UPI00403D4D5C
MAMNYESEAHVVIDGEEFPVYARFTVSQDGPFKRWAGTLASDTPGLGFKLIEAASTSLSMPDGKEARIVPNRENGFGGVSFTGSGPAPI